MWFKRYIKRYAGDYNYKEYASIVNSRPVATLRDLLQLDTSKSISVDDVEPIEQILKRFDQQVCH